MIVFQNDGLIDVRAVTTFGISAKEGESPIGFFGTGLKYAIAIVLRLGGTIEVWRGLEPFRFAVQTEQVRGKDFAVVTMNGAPLGFTTHLGVNWKPWQAFRELYCNVIDEGGSVSLGAGAPDPRDETTTVIVRGQCLDAAYHERDSIVLPQEAPRLYADDSAELLAGPSAVVYYRGVRVFDLPKRSAFTYNITGGLDLTEDRTVSNQYSIYVRLASLIGKCRYRAIIDRAICAHPDSLEYDFDYEWAYVTPSSEFLDAVGAARRDVSRSLNPSALKLFVKHRHEALAVESVELNVIEHKQLDKALAFLATIGHRVDPAAVRVVDSLGPGTMGKAIMDQGLMLIARRCFETGTKYVASTILEEHIHLTRKYADKTYEMQTYLFDQIISLGERLGGEPL